MKRFDPYDGTLVVTDCDDAYVTTPHGIERMAKKPCAMTDQRARELLAGLLGACVQDRALCGWRYLLTEERCVPIPPQLAPRGPFVSRWGSILQGDGWGIMLAQSYATDGCTAADDFSHGATLSRCMHLLQTVGPCSALRLAGPFVSHWAHDFLYQHAEEIAKAWGCSVWSVIEWANELFRWHMEICGTPRGQMLRYYWAVRVFGYWFHVGARLFRKVKQRINGGSI